MSTAFCRTDSPPLGNLQQRTTVKMYIQYMCAMRRCCLLQVTACCFDRNSPGRILKLAHYCCSLYSNILYLLYTQLNSKKHIILRVATTLAQPSASQPPPLTPTHTLCLSILRPRSALSCVPVYFSKRVWHL